MTLDLDRITHPLRLAKGSHQPGSGKGCAMNIISYINGDIKITDYPKCSAPPLAALVQMCNDRLGDDDGYLSPENSILVLNLGWQTVGTTEVPDEMIHAWMAEVLTNPVWGVLRFAKGDGVQAIQNVAELHRKTASGETAKPSAAWSAAESAAWSAAWTAAERAAWNAARRAAGNAERSAAESAESAPWNAAESAAWHAARSAARSAAWSSLEDSAWSAAKSAAESAAWNAAWSSLEDSASSAAESAAWNAAPNAAGNAAKNAAAVHFTRHAIACWRALAGLDKPIDIDVTAVNSALDRIGT